MTHTLRKIICLAAALAFCGPAFADGELPIAAPAGTVMVIPDGRYEATNTAPNYLVQLCRGTDECARRREDLKAFAQAYAGKPIGFGQIDLNQHHEYAQMREADLKAAAEVAAKKAAEEETAKKAPPKASWVDRAQGAFAAITHLFGTTDPSPQAAPPVAAGETQITAIPSSLEPSGYFDSCKGSSPDAVTYVLKTDDNPDLTEGIICTAAELEKFIHAGAQEISANGTPTYSSQPFYDRAALAERLEVLTKPSMVTIWQTYDGQHTGIGPGFVVGINKAGNCEIVTANHVTTLDSPKDSYAGLEVTMANGQTYPTTIALEKRERELTILTATVPADACKPLKIAEKPATVGEQVFMGTLPLPEHFDATLPRWTRGPSDNIGAITEIKPFAALPGLHSRYQEGLETLVEGIQGYKADSGTPGVNVNGEVVSMVFLTPERGGITLAVPARFIVEALEELHRQ